MGSKGYQPCGALVGPQATRRDPPFGKAPSGWVPRYSKEIINHPVPIEMRTAQGPQALAPGP